jgi:hypothetical protein
VLWVRVWCRRGVKTHGNTNGWHGRDKAAWARYGDYCDEGIDCYYRGNHLNYNYNNNNDNSDDAEDDNRMRVCIQTAMLAGQGSQSVYFPWFSVQ